jgi:hypothetical protein
MKHRIDMWGAGLMAVHFFYAGHVWTAGFFGAVAVLSAILTGME